MRIAETTGFNPAFNARSYWAARRTGKPYEIPHDITYPVGSYAEGRGVLVQCTLPEPTMVPADEECHAAVLRYLTSEAVRDRFEKLKQMAAPEVLEKLPQGLQQYVRIVNNKWKDSPTAAVARGEKDLAKSDVVANKTKP
jgi:hypothetical protein